MLKDIKYRGINTESNGYDAAAGQLAVAHNVVNDHGYLETLNPPAEVIEYWGHGLSGYKCVFKHEMLSGRVNYIFYRKDGDFSDDFDSADFVCNEQASLVFLDATAEAGVQATEVTWMEESPIQECITTDGNLLEITAVGNTLCVLTTEGMDYFVWTTRQVDGVAVTSYYELGTELPFADIEFGLELGNDEDQFVSSFILNCTDEYDPSSPSTQRVPGRTATQRRNLIEGLDTAITLMRSSARNNGKFVEPFLVRYAIRLFDGTHIHHSNPVLMQPCGKDGFAMYWDNFTSGVGNAGIHLNIDSKSAKLKMQSLTASSAFDDWRDIIYGIDVYISQPIPYKDYSNPTNCNAGNKYKTNETDTSDRGYYGFAKYTELNPSPHSTDTSTTYYEYIKYMNVWPGNQMNDTTAWSGGTCYCSFIQFADTEFTPDTISLFYKVRELNIDSLDGFTSALADLFIPADVLETLATRPILEDDYHSHDLMTPRNAYAYNQRINLFDVKRISWNRLMPRVNLAYWNEGITCVKCRLYITLSDELGERVLDYGPEDTGFYWTKREHIQYLYVPYPNAIKAELYMEYSYSGLTSNQKVVMPLKRHPSMNGAVYFDGWADADYESFTSYPSASKAVYSEANKVYTSEVDNPFYFPIGGINTIGTGKIMALASNVRAISQGQFGEFPLYVFTDSGIWMLEVDDKGLYKAKQPMSLDKVLPGSKVTSMDNAVAYVTERGLMLVSGSETRCISEVLDGKFIAMPEVLGGFAPAVNWETFKAKVACVYDSDNRRLHVYNPDYLWHYVFSVRTGEWTTMSDMVYLRDTIGGRYVDTEMGLIDFNEEAAAAAMTQTIMTRPISFETDAYKRMRDNMLRGDIDALRAAGKLVSVLLQGSNDLQTWINIGAVSGHYRMVRKTGTPYKWFRWKIVINSLPRDYKLHGMTADVEVTGNNKLR